MTQNDVSLFLSTISDQGIISSELLHLLNDTPLSEEFAHTLWSSFYKCLTLNPHLLFVSDKMVLVDILLRYRQDYSSKHPVFVLYFYFCSYIITLVFCCANLFRITNS